MVREFVVREGCEQDFALIFGPDGIWCDLLRRFAPGYLRTTLLESGDRRYRVEDYWRSHRKFEAFRERHQLDVEKFRDWVTSKELVEHETTLGSFYQDPDEDDDAGLVSA